MTPGFPESLFSTLASGIGAELHLVRDVSGPRPGADPFADGTYDLGWICSTSFVALALAAEDPSVRLTGVAWVPDDPDADGRPVYFGDLVVRADSGVSTLDDLAGARVGCNDPISLSGHYALRGAFEDAGHDPETFAALQFTGGHHASLDGVVAGTLDAAVVDSVVRLRRARHDPAVARLRVVERLGPWPVQPLVARASLDTGRCADVRGTVMELAEQPAVRAELAAAGLRGLVTVDDDHYEPVRRLLRGRRL